jgi:hypothetical protein
MVENLEEKIDVCFCVFLFFCFLLIQININTICQIEQLVKNDFCFITVHSSN